MDTKSLAKSKRAHTQHHSKKSHSVHKQKVSVVSEKNPEKLQGNQTKTPVQSRRVSALPSNWDRYSDDDDDELDAAEGSSISQTTDVTLPKSKGADYLHLISEAQAESHSKIRINSDCLSSLDDLLHDEFSRVVGSMISARGEGIVSWMEDDNFVVEEDESPSYQEPGFLSLNLNALANALEKVDLHERLYIEPDLLPLPELCTAQSKVGGDGYDAEAVIARLNEPAQQEFSGKLKVAKGESSVLEAEFLDQVKEIRILTDESEKASAIEDDLDFLLNSVSEAHTQPNPVGNASSTSNQNPCVQKSSAFETELDSLLNFHSSPEPYNNPDSSSGQKLHTTGFDDVLDDLLESTSASIKPQQNQTSSSSSVGKSKVLDEFDSWLDTI
ncbi:hypothetical protein CARUB_v10028019mg [Capsella rubella]|uniref:Uncharacterized protein n=1 Tax=Capsella rubella TaxID=81985 RepID=R0GU70_9BRAS|nr:uncharacterized protein LOC17875220 [Capsella rubella]EOA14728.1 hypothetical protein CARUB_v10028019mg [Capsella rubella]